MTSQAFVKVAALPQVDHLSTIAKPIHASPLGRRGTCGRHRTPRLPWELQPVSRCGVSMQSNGWGTGLRGRVDLSSGKPLHAPAALLVGRSGPCRVKAAMVAQGAHPGGDSVPQQQAVFKALPLAGFAPNGCNGDFVMKAALMMPAPQARRRSVGVIPRRIVCGAVCVGCQCTGPLTKVSPSLSDVDKSLLIDGTNAVQPGRSGDHLPVLHKGSIQGNPSRPLQTGPILTVYSRHPPLPLKIDLTDSNLHGKRRP